MIVSCVAHKSFTQAHSWVITVMKTRSWILSLQSSLKQFSVSSRMIMSSMYPNDHTNGSWFPLNEQKQMLMNHRANSYNESVYTHELTPKWNAARRNSTRNGFPRCAAVLRLKITTFDWCVVLRIKFVVQYFADLPADGGCEKCGWGMSRQCWFCVNCVLGIFGMVVSFTWYEFDAAPLKCHWLRK